MDPWPTHVMAQSRQYVSLPWGIEEWCGRVMVGSGTDTYDPICQLPKGHDGSCKSTAAIDQHRLEVPRAVGAAEESTAHDPSRGRSDD